MTIEDGVLARCVCCLWCVPSSARLAAFSSWSSLQCYTLKSFLPLFFLCFLHVHIRETPYKVCSVNLFCRCCVSPLQGAIFRLSHFTRNGRRSGRGQLLIWHCGRHLCAISSRLKDLRFRSTLNWIMRSMERYTKSEVSSWIALNGLRPC